MMKTKLGLILIFFLATRLFAAERLALSQEDLNYVVIGAFANQQNAIHFTEKAKKEQFGAQFEINTNRHLFYVYVLRTENRKLAFEQAQDLRKRTSFSDTWVYSGLLGENNSQANSADVHPETGAKLEQIPVEDKSITVPINESSNTTNENILLVKKVEQLPRAEEDGRAFFFKLIRASNQKEVSGDVDVIDSEKQRKGGSYVGNQDVFVRTVNKSGNVLLKCEVFGYRKLEYVINLNDPQATDFIKVENGKVTVPFELIRLKKGDIVVMYNVFFYKDAAIMRPESRSEVTSLLEMMNENPKMKIRIHGHTNGGAAGKIIEVGDSKNFFSLSDTKEGFGSAKKLSEERAQVISDFLLSEGIDPSRMEVKAWGGKKSIYKKDHAQAHENVRVEIEIIEE